MATVALAVGIAWSQSDSASVVSASDAETSEPDPAETEWQPTYQYIALPPSVTPLNGLLPFGGIGSSPRLMSTSKGQVFSHDIDVVSKLSERQIVIIGLIKETPNIAWREISEKLDVSIKTVQRDFADMRNLGVVINREGGKTFGHWTIQL